MIHIQINFLIFFFDSSLRPFSLKLGGVDEGTLNHLVVKIQLHKCAYSFHGKLYHFHIYNTIILQSVFAEIAEFKDESGGKIS